VCKTEPTNCWESVPFDHSHSQGSGSLGHRADAHSHSQRPVPRDFPLFKRCDWLVSNWTVSIWTSPHSQQPVPRDFPLFKRCEWLVIYRDVVKRTSLIAEGRGMFGHGSIGHHQPQRPMPRGFSLFKRCEWLVSNRFVFKRRPPFPNRYSIEKGFCSFDWYKQEQNFCLWSVNRDHVQNK